MKYLSVVAAVLLVGCGGGNSDSKPPVIEPNKMVMSERLHQASWYELEQYFDGVPKYSGAMGTYTAKHIPMAVEHEGTEYYIYSDNSTGNLNSYVVDSKGNKTLVDSKKGVIDPHDNAVVNVIDGYVTVVVSARNTTRMGSIYRATEPGSIEEFELVEQGWYAYPQLWDIAMVHTVYKLRRELWSKNEQCTVQLARDGHYAVSVQHGDWLHVAYNWHEEHSTDKRTNLYYMKTQDGCTWYNKDDQELVLPVAGHSLDTLIHSTDLMYVKDIEVIDGEVRILGVESTSADPTRGIRMLNVYGLDSITPITQVGHNYNTGGFINGYVVTPAFGEYAYAGGDLEMYSIEGELLEVGNYLNQYNYVRKIVNGNGAYVSEAPSFSTNQGAYVRKLEIK